MVLVVSKLQAKVKVCGGEGGADVSIAKRIRQGANVTLDSRIPDGF